MVTEPRQSIEPTYDHRKTGDRFTVETRENDSHVDLKRMPDPFLNHTVHVRGWRNAFRVLLCRYKLTVLVGGDQDIVEDVCELNNDYKGVPGSTRRREWEKQFDRGLHDFAARITEHEDDEQP